MHSINNALNTVLGFQFSRGNNLLIVHKKKQINPYKLNINDNLESFYRGVSIAQITATTISLSWRQFIC